MYENRNKVSAVQVVQQTSKCFKRPAIWLPDCHLNHTHIAVQSADLSDHLAGDARNHKPLRRKERLMDFASECITCEKKWMKHLNEMKRTQAINYTNCSYFRHQFA